MAEGDYQPDTKLVINWTEEEAYKTDKMVAPYLWGSIQGMPKETYHLVRDVSILTYELLKM